MPSALLFSLELLKIMDQETISIPFTPRAKKVLALAIKTAREYGHKFVGVEHMLSGMIREKEGIACRLLDQSGLTEECIVTLCQWEKPAMSAEDQRELAEYNRLKAKFEPIAKG